MFKFESDVQTGSGDRRPTAPGAAYDMRRTFSDSSRFATSTRAVSTADAIARAAQQRGGEESGGSKSTLELWAR